MKKSLLFAAALCAATTGFAQMEVGFMDAAALGVADKPTFAAETPLVETASVKMFWANETSTSAQNCDFNQVKNIKVNGEEIALVPGIGGEGNPPAVNVFEGPTQGGVQYHFQVSEDGWLIVPSKISSNKNFYAYEGTFNGEMNLMAYTLGMALYSADYPELEFGKYELPADELGYCNLEAANIDNYLLGGTAVAWPIRIFTQNADAGPAGNGTGVIMFPVFKDAVDYYVFATGSKMNTCGFVFVPGEAKPSVSLVQNEYVKDDVVEREAQEYIVSGSDAVNSINSVANENAPIYNLNGVRVNADAKGILIQNGKKIVRF